MREENFDFFRDLLRVLEKCESEGKNIEDAISILIDSTSGALTPEQKKILLATFLEERK